MNRHEYAAHRALASAAVSRREVDAQREVDRKAVERAREALKRQRGIVPALRRLFA